MKLAATLYRYVCGSQGLNLIAFFVWGLEVGGGGVNVGTKADQSSAKGHAEEW